MVTTTQDTFVRPRDLSDLSKPDVLYARSYLLIRTVVGLIGVLLPIAFIVGEAFFLRSGVHVRGSISAYYHTSMRDLFVGGLTVVGILLITYMAGQWQRPDWWISLLAGVAVLGVVAFPTGRPSLPDQALLCGSTPEPAGCSPIQQWLGETFVAGVHFVCAAVFVLSLAGISFYFARREREEKRSGYAGAARLQTLCGWLILAAVAWAGAGGALGWDLWEITPLYLGEVVAIWAFAASWLTGSRHLWQRVLPSARPAA